MQLFQILNCTGDISTCCSDYGLAKMLTIIKGCVNLIHIVIPIILIVMVTTQLIKMIINPDNKKNGKEFANKIIAAVLVFFIPSIVNSILGILPAKYEAEACWNAGSDTNDITIASKSVYIDKRKLKQYIITEDPKYFQKGDKPKDPYTPNPTASPTTPSTPATPSDGNGTILLISGHSYPPYCNGSPSDCRGKAKSGYDETDLTRMTVKLIKSKLDGLGVKSDIANALMAGDTDKMNKSFYRECHNNSALCNKYDWSKYKYVLEIHFDSGDGNRSGTLLVKTSSGYSTLADKAIVNAVTSQTGHKKRNDCIEPIHNISYFMKRNIPITYLETEYYDNKSAIENFLSKKDAIAQGIAEAIKQYYG